MKKKLALAFILALAGSAFLFAAGTSAILSPRPAVPAAKSAVPTARSAVPAARHVPAEVLQVRGKIVKIYPADPAKKTAERIVLLAGKRRISVIVYGNASIRDAKGSKLKPALLKAGETVSLSYRQRGKSKTALSIRV
jgi:hypothetical protein